MLQYGFQAKLDIQLGCIFIKDNGRLKKKNKKKKGKEDIRLLKHISFESIHNKWTAVVAFRAICINNYLPNLFPKI
jgi:hypothetical protein